MLEGVLNWQKKERYFSVGDYGLADNVLVTSFMGLSDSKR
jgi:hypothetical protein